MTQLTLALQPRRTPPRQLPAIERLRAAETEMLGALDALVSACELPGDHCEVEQALPAAITVIAKALGVPPNVGVEPHSAAGKDLE